MEAQQGLHGEPNARHSTLGGPQVASRGDWRPGRPRWSPTTQRSLPLPRQINGGPLVSQFSHDERGRGVRGPSRNEQVPNLFQASKQERECRVRLYWHSAVYTLVCNWLLEDFSDGSTGLASSFSRSWRAPAACRSGLALAVGGLRAGCVNPAGS